MAWHSLYLLAGFDDLADKVLPMRRAPRSSGPGDGDGESTEPEATGTPEPSAPETVTPADNGERNGPIGIVS